MMIVWLLFVSLPVGKAMLTLTANPGDVDASTTSVTLTCHADGAGNMTRVMALIIQKQTQTGDWETLAEVFGAGMDPEAVDPNVTTTGRIATGIGQASQLQVTIDGKDAKGQYQCIGIGFSIFGGYMSEQANTEVTSGGYRALLAEIDSRLTKAENALAIQSQKTEMVWDTNAISAMDGEDLFKLLVWPAGQYSLLKPETGCPHQGFSFVNWNGVGFRQFHTESTSPENLDEVSPGCHLKTPITAQNGAKHFMYLYFCTDASTAEKGPEWPEGSYCIFKYVACPEGFHEGSMQWDEENTYHENVFGNPTPSAVFNADTRIYFCCRRDGVPEKPMILPISKPFYLFRFGGECQQVIGANVTNEYLIFDTENTGNNIDRYFNDYHPDGKLDNVRVELCYYERSG